MQVKDKYADENKMRKNKKWMMLIRKYEEFKKKEIERKEIRFQVKNKINMLLRRRRIK